MKELQSIFQNLVAERNYAQVDCTHFQMTTEEMFDSEWEIYFEFAKSGNIVVLLSYSIETSESAEMWQDAYKMMIERVKKESSCNEILILDDANVWG